MDKNKTAADRRHVSASAMLLSVAAILAVLIVALAITPAVEARGESSSSQSETVTSVEQLQEELKNGDVIVTETLKITDNVTINLHGHAVHGESCAVFSIDDGTLTLSGDSGRVSADNYNAIEFSLKSTENSKVMVGTGIYLKGDVLFSKSGQSLFIDSGGKIEGNVSYKNDNSIEFGGTVESNIDNDSGFIIANRGSTIIAGESIKISGCFKAEDIKKDRLIQIGGRVSSFCREIDNDTCINGIELYQNVVLDVLAGAELLINPCVKHEAQCTISSSTKLVINGAVSVQNTMISNEGSISVEGGTLKVEDGTVHGNGITEIQSGKVEVHGDVTFYGVVKGGSIKNYGTLEVGNSTSGISSNLEVTNICDGASVVVNSLLCNTLTINNSINGDQGIDETVIRAEYYPLEGLTVESRVDSYGSRYNDLYGTVKVGQSIDQSSASEYYAKIESLGNGGVSKDKELSVSGGIQLQVGDGSVESSFAINGHVITYTKGIGSANVGGIILEKKVGFTILGQYDAHTIALNDRGYPDNILHFSNYNVDGLSVYTTLFKAIEDCSDNRDRKYTIWSYGDTIIDSNLVITKDITLNVMNELTVNAGTELTVDGILNLYVKGSKLVLKESSGSSGAVIVNGCLSSAVEPDSNTPGIMLGEENFTPVGAYYSIVVNEDGNGNEVNTKFIYISPFLEAIEKIKDAEENEIELKGGDMVFGDISVGGEGDEYRVIVSVGFTAESVTISQISLIFEEGCRVSAIVRNGSATAEIDGMVGTEISFTSCTDSPMSVSGELSGGEIKVRGAMSLNDASVVEATISGNVTISGTSTVDNLIINEDGLVNVPAGTELDADTLKILGSVVLNGNIEAKKIFVGIGEDIIRPYGRTLGAETSVSGSGSISVSGYWVIAEGSDVDGAFLQEYKSTFYDRSSSPNVTAYVPSASDTPIGIITDTAPGNAEWKGWYAANRTTADVSSEPIGTYNTVRSLIDYDIYSVTIAADKAVSKVFIDNELMTRNADGTWSASIAAGMHEISYKLKAGYMGTGVLTQESGGPGISIDGMSITVEGDKADFVLDLSGFTWVGWVDPDSEPPIPFPQPVPTPSSASDEGVTVTDCLLVVLIGIVVITSMVLAGRMLKR